MPMKMGIHQQPAHASIQLFWIPAFAGMTGCKFKIAMDSRVRGNDGL